MKLVKSKSYLRYKNGTYVVNEPNQTDDEQAETVKLEDKPVGRTGILHGVSGELLRFLQLQT